MPGNAKLTSGPIRRHLVEQTLPMVFGIAAIMSVGIIDAFFIGELGPDPLAAISFIFPVGVALSSLGVGVLVGINSVVSRALGRSDHRLAERRAVQGVLIAAATGVVIAALLALLQRPLFSLLGASGALPELIDAYMYPFAAGFPFLLLAMGNNGVLRAQGAAKRSSSILITMAAANWVLDPMLIAGWGPLPGYGIAGAAYASAGAFFLSALLALALAATSRLGLRWRRLESGDWSAGAAELARVGGPAALSNSINPIGLTVLTGFLSSFGNEAVAAFGVAGRLQSFAVVPLLAMSSSIGAIVGQNWGAGQPHRARKALAEAAAFSFGYGLLIAVLLVVFRREAAGIFTDSPPVIESISLYLQIAAWGLWAYGILIVVNGALNAIDQAQRALLLSALRVLGVMVPVAWIGGRIASEAGVYAGELAANLAGAGLAYWIGVRSMRAERCPHRPGALGAPAE